MMWWSHISYGGAHGPDDGLDDCLMMMVDPCWSPCTWWWPWGHVRDDIPCWWWHDTFMCLMWCWWAYEPWWVSTMEMTWWHDIHDGDDMMAWHTWACDEVSYTLSFTYPCASPTYSCNPLQDPHTPLPKPIYPCKPLQTLTHPSLLTTLPHNPSYTLALTSHYTLHYPLHPCFILMLSLYLAWNPTISLTLPLALNLILLPTYASLLSSL